MFLPLDIPFEIWIEHVAFELIYSMFIFYWDSLQGSSGLCNLLSLRYLPPACWSPFWDCGFIWPWACKFDEMDNKFFIVFDMSTYIYILMSQNILIHFLPDFHIYNHDLFFVNYSATIDYIAAVFTLSLIWYTSPCDNRQVQSQAQFSQNVLHNDIIWEQLTQLVGIYYTNVYLFLNRVWTF